MILKTNKADRTTWPLNIQSNSNSSNSRVISKFLGQDFEVYLKIYHSAYIDLDGTPEISHDELDKLKMKVPKTKFEELLGESTLVGQGVPVDLLENQSQYKRILWEDLFAIHGLPFKETANPEVLRQHLNGSFPSNLYGLSEYGFDDLECLALSRLLHAYGCEKVNCYYDYLSSGLLGDVDSHWEAEIVFKIPTKNIIDLIWTKVGESPFWFTPNYLWNDSRTFLIWSDYDLPYSFIGCDNNFLKAMQESIFEYQVVAKKCSYSFQSYKDYM